MGGGGVRIEGRAVFSLNEMKSLNVPIRYFSMRIKCFKRTIAIKYL